jgi:hypothetical protein
VKPGCDLARDLTVGDIMATPLLFFDPDYSDRCLEFCRFRGIDSLPSLVSRELWVLAPGGDHFVKEEMLEKRLVGPAVYVFDPAIRDALLEHGVLFVSDGSGLVGALHGSDYNHPAVSRHLYSLIGQYERALRSLAVNLGLGDSDLVANLKKGPARQLERRLQRDPHAPPFHLASLVDLQSLLNDRFEMRLDVDAIRYVRNATMHSQELVNQVDPQTPEYVYDSETVTRLFASVETLLRELPFVLNRDRIVRGLSDVGTPP